MNTNTSSLYGAGAAPPSAPAAADACGGGQATYNQLAMYHSNMIKALKTKDAQNQQLQQKNATLIENAQRRETYYRAQMKEKDEEIAKWKQKAKDVEEEWEDAEYECGTRVNQKQQKLQQQRNKLKSFKKH